MAVFTTREAAEEFARGDPFVFNGVVRDWWIREWLGALAEPVRSWPTPPPPATAMT